MCEIKIVENLEGGEMAKRMKLTGKRYAEFNTRMQPFRRKITAIVLITVLLAVLVIEASLSFFSDIVIAATNTVLGTVDITMSNVEVEGLDTIPQETPIAFVPGLPGTSVWHVGDVNNFRWTVTNTGRSNVRLTNTLRIAWDTNENLSVRDVIFVYPVSKTDDEIRIDMIENDGAGALISHVMTPSNFEFQNANIRTGFEVILEDLPGINHVVLDGTPEGSATPVTAHTYEFKIVFGVRPSEGHTIAYFDQFEGRNLKVEIETRANLVNANTSWTDTEHGIVMLNNAIACSDHPIWDMIDIPEEVDFEYTGSVQQWTVPVTRTI